MASNKLTVDHYPIVARLSGRWMRAINYDFKIEIGEELAATPRARLLQKLGLIEKVHRRIEERLEMLNQLEKPYPIPIATEVILDPKVTDVISLKEVCKLLGEAPHNVRRMADDGELKITRTRKGHRRFQRSEIEKILLQRQNPPDP